jgi:hypothetical protein
MTVLYDKTDKGREEIATRKYHLSSRLRSLLLVIDGRHDADGILEKFKAIGLGGESMAQLLEEGYIRRLEAPQPAAVAMEVRPQARHPQTAAQDSGSTPLFAEHSPEESLYGGEWQFSALYHFYNETIKSTVGLRGYALQLKVERAGSIEDFRALREPYLKAVDKARGGEMARSLRERLDKLLADNGAQPTLREQGARAAARLT